MRVNVFTSDESFFLDAVEMYFTTSYRYIAKAKDEHVLLIIETMLSVYVFEFLKKGIDGIIDSLEKGRYDQDNLIPCFHGGDLIYKSKNA